MLIAFSGSKAESTGAPGVPPRLCRLRIWCHCCGLSFIRGPGNFQMLQARLWPKPNQNQNQTKQEPLFWLFCDLKSGLCPPPHPPPGSTLVPSLSSQPRARSGTAGSYGGYMFNFIRSCQAVFQSSAISDLHQQSVLVQGSPQPRKHLLSSLSVSAIFVRI